VVFASAPQALAEGDKKPPKPENLLSPDSALERLMKGNDRYVEGVTKRYDFSRERKALSKGQTSPRF
jgi:carbonic anhydrase